MMYSLVNLYQVHKGTDTPPGIPHHRKKRMFQVHSMMQYPNIMRTTKRGNYRQMPSMNTDAKTIRKTLANLIHNLFKRPHNMIKLL